MTASERREKLLDVLCIRRKDKIENLAQEFGVSTRTIRTDIEILTCNYPIETIRGRYGGGVQVADGFRKDRKMFTKEQSDLVKKLAMSLEGHELEVMGSIISAFALP